MMTAEKRTYADRREYMREYRRRPEAAARNREYVRGYLANNPDIRKGSKLRFRYGMTVSEYRALVHRQQERCALCMARAPLLKVDHDHRTGVVRGLLCDRCNRALGMMHDDPSKFTRAISYMDGPAAWDPRSVASESRPRSRHGDRADHLWTRYGLTEKRFNQISAAQGHRCRICLRVSSLSVDHDHATGLVRGLLCGTCNRALGFLRDDKALLSRAASYLAGG